MQMIDFYCKKCRHKTGVSYLPTGKPESIVLPNTMIKCSRCKRVMRFMNFEERMIVEHVKNNKYYL